MKHKIILFAAIMVAACAPTTLTHGIPNYAVVDQTAAGDPYVVRSGQITTQEGWNYLAQVAHGRKVHVLKMNFPAEGTDDPAVAMGFDVQVLSIIPEDYHPLDVFSPPDGQKIAAAKSQLLYCKLHPDTDLCDVHCSAGHDRTGEVVGEYRVDDDGWTKDAAYKEMLARGYHPELHGLHERWENYQPARSAP